jgi:hypothetical protein
MMQIHVALFKWKSGVTEQQVENALQLVRDVKDRVPGIHGIYCGQNTSRWGQGFTHAVVVLGANEAAIDGYRNDTVHQHAAKLIDSMEQDGIGVDFAD